MYIVIYEFKVKENCDHKFINSWKILTNLIQKNEGSLGSRLHKKKITLSSLCAMAIKRNF